MVKKVYLDGSMVNSLPSPSLLDVQRSVNPWPEEENRDIISNQLLSLPTINTSKIIKNTIINGLPVFEDRKSGSAVFSDCPVKTCFASTNVSDAKDAILEMLLSSRALNGLTIKYGFITQWRVRLRVSGEFSWIDQLDGYVMYKE